MGPEYWHYASLLKAEEAIPGLPKLLFYVSD